MGSWVEEMKIRLHAARKRKKLSAYRVAEKVCVNTQAVYKWENPANKYLPRIDHLREVCEYLGISADWLLFGKGEEPAADEDIAKLKNLLFTVDEEYRGPLAAAIKALEQQRNKIYLEVI